MPTTTSTDGLRIDLSMRYNARNGRCLPNKTARAGAENTYTNLTQPTGLAADWAGMNYTNPDLHAQVGFHQGVSDSVEPDSRLERSSYVGVTMFTTTEPQILIHPDTIKVLANLRQEWEQVVEGESLVDVKGSVGLILVDLVIGLALRPSEQFQVLGSALHAELQSILVVIPENGRGS